MHRLGVVFPLEQELELVNRRRASDRGEILLPEQAPSPRSTEEAGLDAMEKEYRLLETAWRKVSYHGSGVGFFQGTLISKCLRLPDDRV